MAISFALRRRWLIPLLLSSVYLALALSNFHGTGFDIENIDGATFTDQLIKYGTSSGAYSSVSIGRMTLPITVNNSYMGAIQVYLLIPFFKIFGASFVSVRLMGLLFGLLVVIFTYYFARSFFNEAVAVFSTTLLIFQPAFIELMKLGAFPDSILNVLSTASLLLIALWFKKKRAIYLYLAALCLGLGLWAKIVFVIFIGALAVFYYAYRRYAPSLTAGQRAIAFAVFLLGAAPAVYMNIVTGGENIRLIYSTVFEGESADAIDNHEVHKNLLWRVRQFSDIYSGSRFDRYEPYRAYEEAVTKRHFYTYFLAFALIFLAAELVLRRRHRDRGKVCFVLGVSLIMFAGLCFTPTVFRSYQLLFLMPLPQLIAGLFIYRGALFIKESYDSKRASYIAAAVLLAIPLYLDTTVLFYTRSSDYVPRKLDSSIAILEVRDYLLAKGIHRLVVNDPKAYTYRKLYFVSGGRIKVFGNLFEGAGYKKYLTTALERPKYVLQSIQERKAGNALVDEVFQKQLNNFNYKATGRVDFKDKVGRLVYILHKLERK